ncbi:MAG: tRNA 4-thiouridine(8) synthase ThiI, partial [Clostridia bacterium]|nr:tRNA 4-thiouridine(8) synthase ThiI [Clostridia bacterium]
ESLGQVASQTLESITSTNSVATIPVFRPLIGFDKDEIIDISQKIGAFEISILPYEDCCTIFLPKRPVTKPRLSAVEKVESALNVEELVQNAMSNIESVTID